MVSIRNNSPPYAVYRFWLLLLLYVNKVSSLNKILVAVWLPCCHPIVRFFVADIRAVAIVHSNGASFYCDINRLESPEYIGFGRTCIQITSIATLCTLYCSGN